MRYPWTAGLLVLAIGAGCDRRQPPEPVAAAFFEKISAKDWRGLFAMASKEEREKMNLDQEQFVRFCEIITEGFPSNLRCQSYAEFKPSPTKRTYAVKMLALPNLSPDIKQQMNALSLEIRMAKGQWYPMISTLPLQLSLFQQEGKQARHERLLKAMEDSHIPWYIYQDSPKKLRVEDQRQVVQGKLQQMEAFR
jgi:hypothetical protein